MGLFDYIRSEYVLKPLATYLIDLNKNKELEKGTGMQGVIRDGMPYRTTYGSQRTKPGGAVDNATLRRFSVQYDVARACINRRKRQLNMLQWDIVPADIQDKQDYSKAIAEIKAQFKGIGGYRVRFREFTDIMVEDLLVLDAVAIEKQLARGGGIYALNVVDASTIRLRVDEAGKTPMPPEVAYRQYIRGQMTAEWNADEMYYEMMNPRTSTPYGLSPLETLVLNVSAALKSDVYNLNMLTEGNIPEGLFGVPESWTPDMIKEFQMTWDAAMAGNSMATSKLMFVPKGSYEPTKKPEDMRFKELQEWLLQKTCMLFEVPPEELGFTKTVNRATADSQKETGEDTGLKPLAHFFEEIFDDVIQNDLGHPELKFKYLGLDHKDDKAIAETNAILVNSGQRTIDEVRQSDGLDPIGVNKPFVIGTPTFIDEESLQATRDAASAALLAAQNQPADGNADTSAGAADKGKDGAAEDAKSTKSYSAADAHIQLVSELRAFRKYAINRKKLGKATRPFTSTVLPESVVTELNLQVEKAESTEQVRGIFSEYMQDYQIDFLADVAALQRDIKQVL